MGRLYVKQSVRESQARSYCRAERHGGGRQTGRKKVGVTRRQKGKQVRQSGKTGKQTVRIHKRKTARSFNGQQVNKVAGDVVRQSGSKKDKRTVSCDRQ